MTLIFTDSNKYSSHSSRMTLFLTCPCTFTIEKTTLRFLILETFPRLIFAACVQSKRLNLIGSKNNSEINASTVDSESKLSVKFVLLRFKVLTF